MPKPSPRLVFHRGIFTLSSSVLARIGVCVNLLHEIVGLSRNGSFAPIPSDLIFHAGHYRIPSLYQGSPIPRPGFHFHDPLPPLRHRIQEPNATRQVGRITRMIPTI